MATYVLYNLLTDEFHGTYEAEEKKIFGGEWGDQSKHAHLEVPAGVDYRKCNLNEVIISEGQTEDDIDFDDKNEYTDGFLSFTKYYKFELNATKETNVDAEDEEAAKLEAKNARLHRGRLFRQLASNIHDIIADHCYANDLTLTQVGTLKANNTEAFQLLSENQPLSAKLYIDAVVADGTLVTQDMLDDVALEYAEFAAAHPDIT